MFRALCQSNVRLSDPDMVCPKGVVREQGSDIQELVISKNEDMRGCSPSFSVSPTTCGRPVTTLPRAAQSRRITP